jgi:DNA-directed RNA polymerase subunit K/omega
MLSEAIKAEIRSIISVVESEKEEVITVIGQKIDQAVAGSLAKIAELEAVVAAQAEQIANGEVVNLDEIKAVVDEVKVAVEAIATPEVPPVVEEPVAEPPVVEERI